MLDPQLTGTVALVTGGAGGIGAAISGAFAAQGAHVAVHHAAGESPATDGARPEHHTPDGDTAARVARDLPSPAIAVAADLSDTVALPQLWDDVETRLGPVDILVNNAAHCESPDTIESVSGAGLTRHYRVNAIAPGPVQTGWLTGELLETATSAVPLGRVGHPDDIADAAVFLASHQARWITGHILQVAGGHAL